MTDFELRLHEVIDNYYQKHQEHPKYISLSHEFKKEWADSILCFPYPAKAVTWHGLHFHWVNRKNYIAAFPRFKSQKQYQQQYAAEWENY